MSLTILADDLTGACDTGSLFAGRAPVPVLVWPAVAPTDPVCVVDTETRALASAEAARRTVAAAIAVPALRVFKKIDSTLRGHVGAEVSALVDALDAPGALVCPAFPAQGRIVVDRILWIDGRPVAETPFADDPGVAARATSSVVDRLRPHVHRPLAWIPLPEVRAGIGALSAHLRRLTGMVAVADAETDEDLAALVEAVLVVDPSPLLVGSAGLARALAARLGLVAERCALPRGARWLVLAGSRHPATRAQVAAARAAGIAVIAAPKAEVADRRRVAAALAAETRKRLEDEAFDIVAVTGGDTAVALWEALAAERLDLVGAPHPGLAFGYLRAPRHPALPVVTKAGGFGGPDVFVALAEATRAC